MKITTRILALLLLVSVLSLTASEKTGSYVIVDTGQETCYNATRSIAAPDPGQPFYGQDAQFQGVQPAYKDNGDGTITDLNTGLMWQKHLPEGKYPWAECLTYAENSTLAGYADWRLPTIKELYSLVLFSGVTGMSESYSVPYLDTDYFDFRFGGEVNPGERFIDSQYATSTIYKGTTMGGNETMFGFNFVDGRIKGYPTSKDFDIKMVRGDGSYGVNDFEDNGDGTITDHATGLMWEKSGSTTGMNWEDALAWAEEKNEQEYLGYSDWRLPNAKELQSIVDYERSPSYTQSAAISPLFHVPEITNEAGEKDYPFYWTSTTHVDGPQANKAVYICFGRALGYMHNQWMDVHGAGAQRSDPKDGDPDDYPSSFGPQGDVLRVFNYVRLVRNVSETQQVEIDSGVESIAAPESFSLKQNYPNPFNPVTQIGFFLETAGPATLTVFDVNGRVIRTIVNGVLSAGYHEKAFDASDLVSGFYFYRLTANGRSAAKKMTLLE